MCIDILLKKYFSGQYSSYFLMDTLKTLVDLQELPDEDFPFRKQVALVSMTFIRWLHRWLCVKEEE